MNKILLLSSSVALLGAASAQASFNEPKVYTDMAAQHISPDGKYIASSVYELSTILDLTTGQKHEFSSDYGYFSFGVGNCMSATGIVLLAEDDNIPSYWKDGETHNLSYPDNAKFGSASNGITPDGSRICGYVGTDAANMDDQTMVVPAYWDAKADGTYGEYVLLPHPATDFTGRAPQYITATAISDDGKTIAGQVVDYSGAVADLIIYTQGADGTWSYEMPLTDLLNPDKIEIPEWPGEGPDAPDEASYLTPEEKAEYDKAYEAWAENGYDYTLYPNVSDYLSAEGKAAYDAAYAKYEEEYAVWSEKFDAFSEVLYSLLDKAPSFAYNNLFLTGDAKYIGLTNYKEEFDFMTYTATIVAEPWRYNVKEKTYEIFETEQPLLISSLSADGTIFASTSIYEASKTFVSKDKTLIPLQEWLAGVSEESAEWMDENMRFSYEDMDPETYEPIPVEGALLSGIAVATPDLSVIATYVMNIWDFETVCDLYVFDLRDSSAIGNIGVNDITTADKANGIYDLSGRKLNAISAPGLYIVNGKKTLVK